MASSSVSQESLDREDYEIQNARRSRVRVLRTRGHVKPGDDGAGDGDSPVGGEADGPTGYNPAAATADHESPTRNPKHIKDKRTRPSHLHKGKTAKDKRKLREKRRSTGVVHLPSTEVSITPLS